MASVFHGPIDAHVAIPAPHCGPGGVMNFNFGSSSADDAGRKRKCEPFCNVPFAPDADFVDRPNILTWVRNKCAQPGGRAALVGLGGVGKSQLAIQYAHDVRDVAPQTFVLWVYASSRAQFEEAYRSIADRLELSGRHSANADVSRLVSDWLSDEANGRWTMVLDNVDHVETFFPSIHDDRQITSLATYLPQSRNGSILVTSRSKDAAHGLVGSYSNMKEVSVMDTAQGLELLRNKLQNVPNEEHAADLLHALDYMPLAISQAAAYINRRAHMTTIRYLAELSANSKKKESLLDWETGDLRRDVSASKSLVRTWQMSFERIQQERPSAANLLSLMSMFDPQGIPESILRRYSKKASNQDDADKEFEADLDLLQVYSLVTAAAGTDVCEMHSLVQFCTQVWLSSSDNVKRWESDFIELMAEEFPVANFENWAQCQQLLPHVESLFERSEPVTDTTRKAWAQVLTNAAWYMWMRGNYKTGHEIVNRAFTLQEKVLGPDHEATLTTLNILGLLLHALGKYNDAERFHREALAARERIFGTDHEVTLISISNLAVVLQSQGRYNESEQLNRRALQGRHKRLGEQHPDTLMNMNNLASSLQAQGRYDEAVTLYRQALEGRKPNLSDQHPLTLTSMNNLASALLDQGKYDEAESLHRQVLAERKKVDDNHPLTWTSMSNLARVLHAQQKYQEAETLNRLALERREKELGKHHPDTLRSVNNLANPLAELKRYEEAGLLYQRACDGLEQSLGPHHPWTIACRSDFSAMHVKKQLAWSPVDTSARCMRG